MNIRFTIGRLYWNEVEFQLKRAQMADELDDYIVKKGWIEHEVHLYGAGQPVIDYLRKVENVLND